MGHNICIDRDLDHCGLDDFHFDPEMIIEREFETKLTKDFTLGEIHLNHVGGLHAWFDFKTAKSRALGHYYLPVWDICSWFTCPLELLNLLEYEILVLIIFRHFVYF